MSARLPVVRRITYVCPHCETDLSKVKGFIETDQLPFANFLEPSEGAQIFRREVLVCPSCRKECISYQWRINAVTGDIYTYKGI